MRKALYQLLSKKKNYIMGIDKNDQLLLILLAQIGIYVDAFILENEMKDLRVLNKRIISYEQIKEKDSCNIILYCMNQNEEINKKKGILKTKGFVDIITIYDFDVNFDDIYFSPSLLNRVICESKDVSIMAYGLSHKMIELCRILEMLDAKIQCFLIDDKSCLNQYEIIFDYPIEIREIYDVVYLKSGSYRILAADRSSFKKFKELGLREGVDYADIEHDYRFVDNPKVLDPILGYSWKSDTCDIPGFVLYGDKDSKYRIVTLGGSTSDSMFDPYYSWPKQLYEKLKDTYDICVYSGGCEGYKSSQELMKLIRDVIPLKPDLVIDYSGYNDGFDSSTVNEDLEDNAFYNYFQISLIKSFSKQGKSADGGHSLSTKTGYVLGNVAKCEREEMYLRNIEMMYTVSNMFNIKYICFLQPCLIRKRKKWGRQEKEMFLCNDYGEMYFEAIDDFYNRLEGKFNDYFIDATQIFDNCEKSLNDECHATREGNNIVSNFIYSYINEKVL